MKRSNPTARVIFVVLLLIFPLGTVAAQNDQGPGDQDPLDIGTVVEQLVAPLAFLVGLVLALVEFFKKTGLKGTASLVLGMILGILFGGGYYLASFNVPQDITGWFMLIIVALLPGLAASGVYDFSKKFKPQ